MPNNNKTVPPLILQKSRIQSVPNYTSLSPIKSTLDDDFITPNSSKRLLSSSQSPNSVNHQQKQQKYVSRNRFSLFSNQIEDSENLDNNSDDMEPEPEQNIPTTITAKPSPPPIFIHAVNDFNAYCNTIKEVTKGEQFTCKSTINGVKLSNQLPDSYRAVIKFLQCNKADFHTYQSKEDRAYRVVIRNLHHTTPIEEIKKELLSLSHLQEE